MKAEKTLALAIARNLTIEQQHELETLINQFASATKCYGMDLCRPDTSDATMTLAVEEANKAWSNLRALGLNVAY